MEEVIIGTIFATPRSVGSRNVDVFCSVSIPTLSLVCCVVRCLIDVIILYLTTLQLYCALEEWRSGAFVAIKFEVTIYRKLYLSIADLNLQTAMEDPYLCAKLKALWARIYSRGW